jgi:hypothetical protein
MSVVSSQLGLIDVPVMRRKPNVAVQYAKNDSGSAEPADFTQGAQMPCFNGVNPSGENYTPPTSEGLPLAFRQYGSGFAEMLNADTPAETAQLDVPSYYPLDTAVAYKGNFASIPAPVPFNYDMGIRDGPRAINFEDFAEPAATILYRKDMATRGIPSSSVGEGISFDVGIEELRKMASRREQPVANRPKLLRPDDLIMRLPALERPD